MAISKPEVIPKISHRLYAILVQIYHGPKSAIGIRKTIQSHGFTICDHTFYRDMNKLVSNEMAKVTKYVVQSGGAYTRRCQYEITAKGKVEIERCRDFYKRWYQLTEEKPQDNS